MHIPKFKFHWLFSFLAGTLFAFAFPKFNLFGLAWITPGLVLWLAGRTSGRSIFLSGFLSGLGCWLIMVAWLLLIPFHGYGLAAYLGQVFVGSAYMGLWCWLCWGLWPDPKMGPSTNPIHVNFPQRWSALNDWQRLGWPLMCAVAWVATEMAFGRLFTGFPGYLGASQFHWLGLIQISSWTGVYGVSFVIVWVSIAGFCGAMALKGNPHSFRVFGLPLLPPLLGLAALLAFGHHQLSLSGDSTRQLKIALVQPAIPQSTIWDPSEGTNRFLKLLQISRTALAEKPDLLVWPEAALPQMITRNQYTQDTIAELLQPYHSWMVMGASDYENMAGADGSDRTQFFNSAFLISPDGQMAGRYHKRHLVPFGEFMPGARWFPILAKLRKAGAGLTSGDRPGLLHMTDPAAQFSVLICYEDLFPQEVRTALDAQTDYLLNLTNDGWFGNSGAQWLHAVNALFRSVELHLPLVRCCNNGITCWIDACGRLHDVYFPGSLNEYQSGYKLITVPLAGAQAGQNPTFYRQYGDVFGWGCVGLTVFFGIKQCVLRRCKRRLKSAAGGARKVPHLPSKGNWIFRSPSSC